MKLKLAMLLLCWLPLVVTAQSIRIQGTVVDDTDGTPLPGVTVTLEGSGQTTATDYDGQYEIIANGKGTLVFTFVGMTTERRTFTGSTTINVRMTEDTQVLDELVVVGYGTMRKSDLTGSVASIGADKLKKTPAANLDQALQGRAAGVTVNANSGQPGAGAQVRIRGIGTVNNADPVYVVDGVICNDINFLSPADIASTEILKDASATAIYGSRGANGVVLVTTKKGDTGQSHISFDMYVGVQNRWKKLDLMDRDEFVNTYLALNGRAAEIKRFEEKGFNEWLQQYKLGTDQHFAVAQTERYPDGLDYSAINTDWQDEVFARNAVIQNYHLSIDGGTDKANYSFSGSWFDQDGIIRSSDFKRLTLRANTSFKVKPWFKIGENLSYVYSWGRSTSADEANADSNLLSQAISMAPWDPTYYPAGAINNKGVDMGGKIGVPSNNKNVYSPMSSINVSHPRNVYSRWIGDIYAEITPWEWLTYRADVSYDDVTYNHRLFKDRYEVSSYDQADKNYLERSLAHYTTLVWENTLTFTKQLNADHYLNAMVGQTTEEFNWYQISGSGNVINNPVPRNWFLGQTTETNPAGDSVDRTRRMSWLGRVHYTFKDRYMATFNFRADGSNKFPENTWGYFPSLALAWRMSEEPWLKRVEWLDNLKLRAGWGRIGNDKIGNNAFVTTIFNTGPTFVGYSLGGDPDTPGATVLIYPNQGGLWEKTETWNLGIDASVLRGRLTATFELFQRDTKDMIVSKMMPAQMGQRYNPQINAATVRNRGIELTLGHQNTLGDFHYAIDGNVSMIENKLTHLNGGTPFWVDGVRYSDEGLGLFTFWGYDYMGVFNTQEEADAHWHGYAAAGEVNPFHAGDAIYADLDGDGRLTDDGDRKDIGNPFPWLSYGLNLACDWRGFDLSLFFQGVAGNEIYNMMRVRTEYNGTSSQLSTAMRDVWTQAKANEGIYGTIPNPNGNTYNRSTSSRFVEKGDYLRLKNVQLGYTLPNSVARRMGMSKCRLYVSASNLLTFTGYKGYDPEVAGGVDWGNYPQSRTYMFGLNLSF
ncbi:MAG: TonB-dependent receptor [Muribaculaceae bacterium]|nr:TonB-dependent receptor [Muribaculaceae bacterium]